MAHGKNPAAQLMPIYPPKFDIIEKVDVLLLWTLIAFGLLAFLFRKSLKAKLEAALPDKNTRHRLVGTIIMAFVLVFAIRLIVRFWGN